MSDLSVAGSIGYDCPAELSNHNYSGGSEHMHRQIENAQVEAMMEAARFMETWADQLDEAVPGLGGPYRMVANQVADVAEFISFAKERDIVEVEDFAKTIAAPPPDLLAPLSPISQSTA